jgi:hypothetical protein
MKTSIFLLATLLTISLCLIFQAQAVRITLAYIDDDGEFDDTEKAELDWAKKNYNATLLVPKGSGRFDDEVGKSHDLEEFGVVWWYKANSTDIAPEMLDSGTKRKVPDYLNSGGAMLCSQVAFHYAFDLGLESKEPRIFGPNVDSGRSGFVAAEEKENHPIFNGFDKNDLANPEKGIPTNTYGHDSSSDFYPDGGKDNESLGLGLWGPPVPGWFGTVQPISQHKPGKGTLLITGWRETVLREEKGKFYDNMVKLHANIMEYLAGESVFSDVSFVCKVAMSWGHIKLQ